MQPRVASARGDRPARASLCSNDPGRRFYVHWATWCAPCRDEIPYLQSLYDKHRAEGLEIVGVSVDARGQESAIREFADEFRMTYPIWLDPDERVQSLYLALGVPSSYLIDRTGILRWRRLGTIRKSDTTLTHALTAALR